MKSFSELAPVWDERFKKMQNDDKDVKYEYLLNLGYFDRCVIGECIKNTDPDILVKDESFDFLVPTCETCHIFSLNYLISNIKHDRYLKESIDEFYKEMVPRIEEHFNKEHIKK